jgi:magnesium transporter
VGAASVDESFYTPPLRSVKKRLPWMAGNIFLNLGAVAVIASYEATIEAVAALAIFLPMITDMGGNVGIQALSVSIRSLALGEVRISEYLKAAKKGDCCRID